jgi:hypothetical protein
MQSKKLNKGEDSMKTCQIMLFGVGISAYPFFFLISVVICVNKRRKFSVLSLVDTDSDADLDENTPINTRLGFRVPQNDLILY